MRHGLREWLLWSIYAMLLLFILPLLASANTFDVFHRILDPLKDTQFTKRGTIQSTDTGYSFIELEQKEFKQNGLLYQIAMFQGDNIGEEPWAMSSVKAVS